MKNINKTIVAGVLVLLGIIIMTCIVPTTKQLEEVSYMTLSGLQGWVLMLETLFISVLFVFVLLDWQSANTIKVMLVSISLIMLILAVLGANIVGAISLTLCLSLIYFNTTAFNNRYIKLFLGILTGGLIGSFLQANLQGSITKYVLTLLNFVPEAYSIWDVIVALGLIGIAVVGELELIKYIQLKRCYSRIR